MIQRRDSKSPTSSDGRGGRFFGSQQSDTPNTASAPEPSALKASSRDSGAQARTGAVPTIGATMTLKGDLVGSEDVTIKGNLEGSVTLKDNDIVVDQSGHLEGSVIARHVLVRGMVNGDIEGLERVTVATTGRVEGTITAPRVVLEDGGKFKGMIDMPMGEKAGATAAADPAGKSGELNKAAPQRAKAAEAGARP